MRALSVRGRIALGTLLTVTAAWSAVGQTTGTIRGSVSDSSTKSGIPIAQITLVGTRLGAVSREDGSYVINGVPAGDYKVHVARIGYAPQDRSVTVAAGSSVTLDFLLGHTATKLDQVV